jgi:HlyD family secretion protein
MKLLTFRLLKWLLVLAVIGGAIYWFRFSPTVVQKQTIGRGEIVAEALGTGTLEARVKVTVSPKISGRLQEIRVDQGDQVAQGDLLVRLDDAELRQQVEIAQASLAASKAAVQRLKTDRRRSEAVLAQARRQHQRVRQLMELFAKVAHDHGAGVIVVTHDHRVLDVFDMTYEMEDGFFRPSSK